MATDSFTGSNNDPLSANWTAADGSLLISDANNVKLNAAQGNSAYWDADTFADDQYSQVVIATVSGDAVGPMVRASGLTGYIALVGNSGTEITIQRVDGDENATVLGATFTGLTIGNGDTIRLEASGTSLTVKQNGATIGSRTDSTYTSGAAGIF